MAGSTARQEIIAKAAMVKLTGNGLDFFTADDILTVAGIDHPKLLQIKGTLMDKVGELADDPEPLV